MKVLKARGTFRNRKMLLARRLVADPTSNFGKGVKGGYVAPEIRSIARLIHHHGIDGAHVRAIPYGEVIERLLARRA